MDGFFGGLGEWLNPPDCKSGARKGYVGSNPTPSTTELMLCGKFDRPGKMGTCKEYLNKNLAHLAQAVRARPCYERGPRFKSTAGYKTPVG